MVTGGCHKSGQYDADVALGLWQDVFRYVQETEERSQEEETESADQYRAAHAHEDHAADGFFHVFVIFGAEVGGDHDGGSVGKAV